MVRQIKIRCLSFCVLRPPYTSLLRLLSVCLYLFLSYKFYFKLICCCCFFLAASFSLIDILIFWLIHLMNLSPTLQWSTYSKIQNTIYKRFMMILRCQVGHSWVKHTQTIINNARLLWCRVQTTFRMCTHHPSREDHWAPMLIFLNACQKSPKILLHHLQPQRDTMMIIQELCERSVALRANWRGYKIGAGEHTVKRNLAKKRGYMKE